MNMIAKQLLWKISLIYNKNIYLWIERVKGLYKYEPEYRDLTIPEICNSLSHLKALQHISDSNNDISIVLEDDVILPLQFDFYINEIIDNIPSDFDMVFFGNSYSLSILDEANLSKSIKVSEKLYKKSREKQEL